MAWFEKKEKSGADGIPSLPELPKLPELPDFDDSPRMNQNDLPHLPSYPNSSFGQKFSQNAIKDAVSGEKEDEEGEADEFPGEREIMPRPPQINFPKRMSMPSEEYPRFDRMKSGKPEPVFIRIDKFEESLRMLEDAKKKLNEMDGMLRGIKKIKEEEDRELKHWEAEIQTIKGEFEKINQDLFSRI